MYKHESKDPENRSKKLCCCGGHNASNVKRNLHHNSTKKKHGYKLQRKFENHLYGVFEEDILHHLDYIDNDEL